MPKRVTLGFSSCPNDTFMFHALATGAVSVDGVEFEIVMEDIEALNRRAVDGEALDITKLSVGALGHTGGRYAVLGAGAALGRGCGPLVVRRRDRADLGSLDGLAGLRVAVPGLQTTAFLLLSMFGPAIEPVPMRFDEVMPAVTAGAVDAGLIIHESRFTYGDHGLDAIADLGELWEAESGSPLPLGVIAIDRSRIELASGIEDAIRRSVEAARADPHASRAYIREHAQEVSDAVCDQHIALYVNEFSARLGNEGRDAIRMLLARGGLSEPTFAT